MQARRRTHTGGGQRHILKLYSGVLIKHGHILGWVMLGVPGKSIGSEEKARRKLAYVAGGIVRARKFLAE